MWPWSQFYALQVDESIAVAIVANLLVYVRYFFEIELTYGIAWTGKHTGHIADIRKVCPSNLRLQCRAHEDALQLKTLQ